MKIILGKKKEKYPKIIRTIHGHIFKKRQGIFKTEGFWPLKGKYILYDFALTYKQEKMPFNGLLAVSIEGVSHWDGNIETFLPYKNACYYPESYVFFERC